LIVVTVLSAGLAIVVWRRQRRYGAAGTALWMIFVVLGGLPGLLAYRFHRRWPVLQACPACGETVPRDRDACAHCGAEFPSPAPKGIEVFAP
jgi:ribosomal protein L32